MSESKFCLLMIVRDESPIITRALNSLKNIFDSYIISDTGSTDDTIDVINTWMLNNNKTGEIVLNEWKNFGYNKSLLWKYAYENSKSKYFIFLDADEVFIKNETVPDSYLTIEDADKLYKELENSSENIYKIQTVYGTLKYVRWNMCRNNQLYVWKQPVHEYFEGTVNGSSKNIDWIYNLARKEGNSSRNPDRYKLDADMLLEYLEENPNNDRATFYLAQTYESVDVNKAIEYYKKCVDIENGWVQQRYIACLRLSRRLSNVIEKIKYLTIGNELCSSRLECLYELMMIEYNRNNYSKGYSYGIMNKSRSINSTDLFIEYAVYEYKFDFTFSICCYHVGEFQKAINSSLTSYKKSPQNISNAILPNLRWYTPTDKVVNDNTLMVIDNFYKYPESIRKYGLSLEYNTTGNYPGFRSECQLEKNYFVGLFGDIKDRFEGILGKKIVYFPTGYNSSFQYATDKDKSWIHRDKTEWSVIIYLTPDAPVDSGTLFYRHKDTGIEYIKSVADETLLNGDTYKPDKWELVDKIGNKFNRCVMFRGKRTHISGNYFGNTKENGRLFQVFFFDT